MKYTIAITTLALLLTGCGGGSSDNGTGQGIPSITREFRFNGNQNLSISPVQISENTLGVGCEATGSITNISNTTCSDIFIDFNATDQNGIIISQALGIARNVPSNTSAAFSAVFTDNRNGASVVKCSDIDDIQLSIRDFC